VQLGGHTIRPGDPVSNLLGAANRDPERFSNPQELDFERGGSGHVSFGHGIHYCVGAGLSRLEAPIALTALLARFPGMSLTGEAPLQWKRNLAFHGVENLPARLA
jgi:cytochrome P450